MSEAMIREKVPTISHSIALGSRITMAVEILSTKHDPFLDLSGNHRTFAFLWPPVETFKSSLNISGKVEDAE